jgi:hypothetical protein
LRQNFINDDSKKIVESKVNDHIGKITRNSVEEQILEKSDKTDKNLYNKNIDQWREIHGAEIANGLLKSTDAVAGINVRAIKNTLTNAHSSQIIMNPSELYGETRKSRYLEADVKEVYEKMGMDAFEHVLDLNETGSKYFVGKTATSIAFQHTNRGVKQNYDRMMAGIKNSEEKGLFVDWDTETMSGTNKFGKQIVDQMTEFTFKVANYDDGSIVKGRSYGSIIGATEAQYNDYLKKIERYENGGSLSNLDRVELNRLALMGKSKVKETESGIHNYSYFAGAEEVAENRSEDMRAGLEQLFGIGKAQQAKGAVEEYGGQKMFAWEKKLFQGLDEIIQNDLTAVGHNTLTFDNGVMLHQLQHGMWSAGGKAYADQMLKATNGLHFEHENDTIAMIRQSVPDRLQIYRNADGTLNQAAMQYNKEHGLTLFQQEAIQNAMNSDFYASIGAAHTSDVDVQANAMMYASNKLKLNTEESFFKGMPESAPSIQLTGGSKQLLYAMEGGGIEYKGLLGFVTDPLTGDIRTSDKYRMSKVPTGGEMASEVNKDFFATGNIHKGVSYTISNATKVETSDEFRDLIGKYRPGMDVRSLVAVQLMPVSNSKTMRAKTPYTLIGSMTDVQDYINHTFLHTGHAVEDSQGHRTWTANGIPEESRRLLQVREFANDGVHAGFKDYSLEDQLAESSYRLTNESAARVVRAHELKKDVGVLRYVQDMDKYARENAIDPTDEYQMENMRQKFRDSVFSRSKSIESKIRSGKGYEAEEMVGTFHDYFGYIDRDTKNPMVWSDTVMSALDREGYVRKNQQVISGAIKHAYARAGESVTDQDISHMTALQKKNKEASAYYRMYMESATDAAIRKFGSGRPVGEHRMGIHTYELNQFEFDMNGYKGNFNPDNDIFSVHLGENGNTMVNRLLRHQGLRTDISDEAKIAELRRFQKFIGGSETLSELNSTRRELLEKNNLINIGEDTIDSAATKIITPLQNSRQYQPAGGRITPTLKYELAASMENMGLDNPEEVLSKADKTIPKISIYSSKTGADSYAHDIVNSVLFNDLDGKTLDEVRDDLQEYGYTREQAEKIIAMREQRKADAQPFMKRLIESVQKNGGSIGYNAEDREVFVSHKGKTTKLNNLPMDEYSNGMFYTRVNNSKVHASSGFYATGKYKDGKGTLKFGSSLLKAGDSVGWMDTAIARGAENGDLGDEVNSVLSGYAKVIRENSSIMEEDLQDMRGQFDINYREVAPFIEDNWDQISQNMVFDDSPQGQINQILRDAAMDGKLSGDRLNFELNSAIIQNADNILPVMAQKYGGSYAQTIMSGFSLNMKHAGELKASATEITNFGDDLDSGKRDVASFTGRAYKFRADGKVDGVRIGQSVTSEIAGNYAEDAGEGISYGVDTTLRTGRVRMTTSGLRNLVNSADIDNDYVRDVLTGIHLDEGSAAADPRLIDQYFTRRKSMQRIAMHRIFDMDKDTIDNLSTKQHTAPILNIDPKTGNISFTYSNGLFVESTDLSGESPISVKGFQGAKEEVAIKEAGLFNVGFFSKKGNLFADQQSVTDLLNSKKYHGRIVNAEDSRLEALNVLNEVYNASFYNLSLDANGNTKLGEQAEKGMYNALFATPGAIDKRVGSTLDRLGLSSMKDLVPRLDFIESLNAKDISKTPLGAMISAKAGRNVSHDEILKVIGSEFNSAKSMYDAMMEERYKPWDTLESIARNANVIKNGETVHAFSNTIAAENKHLNARSVLRVTDNLLEKYNGDAQKVASLLQEAMPGIHVGGSGRLYHSGDIDIDAVMEIANKELDGNVRTFYTNGNKTISAEQFSMLPEGEKGKWKKNESSYAYTELMQLPDQDRERLSDENGVGKTLKMDHRTKAMLDTQVYSKEGLKNVRNGFVDSMGKEAGEAQYRKYFMDAQNGKLVAEGLSDKINDSRYYDPGDKRVAIDGGQDLTKKDKEEISKAKEELRKSGINKKIADQIIEEARTAGVKDVGVGAIKKQYSYNMYSVADDFNRKGGLTKDDMIKKWGYKEPISLTSLITGASDTVGLEKSMYGSNTLIDLHIPELGDHQIYDDEAHRYMALPWADPKTMGSSDELARTAYQKKIAGMQNVVNRMRRTADENNGQITDKEKIEIQADLKNRVTQTHEAIAAQLVQKKGLMAQASEAHFGDAGFNKAYGIQLEGNEKGFWGNINFDGLNISKEAGKGEAGLEIDYQVAGMKARNRFYNDKYFKSLGLDEETTKAIQENTFDRLNNGGTLSLNIRNPQGYDKSTSAAAMYFDKSIKGNTLATSAVMWESKKGDYDSDEADFKILKGRATIVGNNGKQTVTDIDYATYQTLQQAKEKGIIKDISMSEEGLKLFADTKKSIMYNAADRNKASRSELGNTELGQGEYNYSKLYNESLEGNGNVDKVGHHHLTTGLRELAPERKMQLANIYKDTEQAVINKVGQEAYDKLDNASKRSEYFNYVSENMTGEASNEARKAASFNFRVERSAQDAEARARKVAAGEMNDAVFKYFRVAEQAKFSDGSKVYSGEDLKAMAQVHTALNEAFLSPKNEKGVGNISIASQLRDAFQDVYHAARSNSLNTEAREKARNKLIDIIDPIIQGRRGKEVAKIPGMELDAEGKATEAGARHAAEIFASVADRVSLAGVNMNTLNMGVTSGATSDGIMHAAYQRASDNMIMDMAEHQANIQRKINGNGYSSIEESTGIHAFRGYEKENAELMRENAAEAARKLKDYENGKAPNLSDAVPVSRGLGKEIGEALSHMKITGKGFAKGMLGIAGSLLVSGYANNPSAPASSQPAPAETQAQGATDSANGMSETQVPNLSDGNVNVLRGGPKSGYVININATSPRGQSAAQNAISQAIGGAVPMNSSINVATNTSYKDKIDQFQIGKIIEGMF